MSDRRVLFVSGSIGLGHVTRDLAIARELRALAPVEVTWLAAPPADQFLRESGETLHQDAAMMLDMSALAEGTSGGGQLNLVRYSFGVRSKWNGNFELVDRIMSAEGFDLLVGDETYEISLGYRRRPDRKKKPFVMIYDFVGFEAMSRSPLEKLGVYIWNRKWAGKSSGSQSHIDLGLFIGEEADVPDASFGPLLPNRRDWARRRCRFVGYVLDFDPSSCADRVALRADLGYDDSPLVVCAVGGTAIGRELLELCVAAWPALRESVPGIRMVLVCGPRLAPGGLDVPEGITVRGYVHSLYRHLAASDFAVVQGGGTVTLELTALRRPFAFFPIEGHCEQEVSVAGRLERHGAGIRLRQSATAPADLARTISENLGAPVTYGPIPVDGARLAAEAIRAFL